MEKPNVKTIDTLKPGNNRFELSQGEVIILPAEHQSGLHEVKLHSEVPNEFRQDAKQFTAPIIVKVSRGASGDYSMVYLDAFRFAKEHGLQYTDLMDLDHKTQFRKVSTQLSRFGVDGTTRVSTTETPTSIPVDLGGRTKTTVEAAYNPTTQTLAIANKGGLKVVLDVLR